MKPKGLIKFVEKNRKEIKKYNNETKDESASENNNQMMSSRLTCVLRPWSLPFHLADKMTDDEYYEYDEAAESFIRLDEVDKAVEWVKNWVNKK